MYPVWLLCLSSFKNKKTQNSFIALIMMLSTLLLSTAVLVMNNTGSIYLDMHDKVQGAHQLIRLENGLHNPEEIEQWWQQQQNVTTSELMRYRTLTGVTHNGKEISNFYSYMMDTPAVPFSVDKLIFAEGSETIAPAPGTVWIPTALAYAQEISIGDQITFSTEKDSLQLKVAAIVVDISYCSPFATSGRIWMNHADYQQHSFNMQGTDMYMMGVRFDDYSENRSYWEALEETLGSPYLESTTYFEGISSHYMITKETISLWGYDAADISLRIDNPSALPYEELEKQVLLDKRVKNYSRLGELNGVIPIDDHDLKKGTTNVQVMALDGNYNDIGYVNLEGRNPQSDDEITIGINIAKTLDKKVGDPMIVYIKGQQVQFTVTGIYQAISNMAYTARISTGAVMKIDPLYNEMEDIFVNVHDGVSPESFVKELQEKYGHSIWAATQRTLVDEVFSQATAILILPMTVMGLLFVIVTLVIIYSICRIQIKKESRTYGIYQSIGMTTVKARVSIALKILVLSIIGAVVGVPIGLFGLPLILPLILADYGIINFPLFIHWGGVAAAVAGSILAAVIGAWIASNMVKTATPRMLTVD